MEGCFWETNLPIMLFLQVDNIICEQSRLLGRTMIRINLATLLWCYYTENLDIYVKFNARTNVSNSILCRSGLHRPNIHMSSLYRSEHLLIESLGNPSSLIDFIDLYRTRHLHARVCTNQDVYILNHWDPLLLIS